MSELSPAEIKKAVRQVRAEANRRFGEDWSLNVKNDEGMEIEGRHTEGNIVRSIVWRGGRIESRTAIEPSGL